MQLPVLEHRAEIERAISENQVVVVCGETGSGKTTQIPQICLDCGRGARGRLIGVTQPRRLAATTVAERVAQELGRDRNLVGWQHRFARKISRENRIKFMTDGILLAELRSDPLLRAYDTVMVDEAHERTLNVDFVLGCLKRILPRRPDLHVIVSSATLETKAFSDFFGGAPVLSIPGRTFPVETRWRPPEGEEPDLAAAVADAVEECLHGPFDGDILVFLPGERDIRAAAEVVRARELPHVEALPLLASLPPAEQRRAFETIPGTTRVVLATNVAETSVTIPGVRYVIDSGLARIARHNPRAGVRRLHVEPVSQASAEQRKGRCGRIGPGVCIRLYDEADFARRPAQTDPEIRRASLAGTILFMLESRLGAIEDFDFLQPPSSAAVRDGWKRLTAIGAVTEERRLTSLGRRLAHLPLEPEHARMLFEAADRGVLDDALTVVSALACEDPLLRPQEKIEQARQAHARFRDKTSDFAGVILLWRAFHDPAHPLSRSAARRLAADSFVSWRRMCEWEDVREELERLVRREMTSGAAAPLTAQDGNSALHQALLSGLLRNIGRWDSEAREYRGAGGLRFSLFPGSGLAKAKTPPEWIVCAELVDTARLYARRAAAIDPTWIEPLARHLCRYSYTGESWDGRAGTARALRKAVLYGLVVQEGVRCDISRANPALCRSIFIRDGLVGGDFPKPVPEFVRRNLETIAARTDAARKTRSASLEAETESFCALYEAHLAPEIVNVPTLRAWLRSATPTQIDALLFERRDFVSPAAKAVGFPDRVELFSFRLPLSYKHEPGADDDGITCTVPPEAIPLLPLLEPSRLVPGALRGKAAYLLRTLPRGPLGILAARCGADPRTPDFDALADAVLAETAPDGPFLPAFTRALAGSFGVRIPAGSWREEELPDAWRIRWRVSDRSGATRFATRNTDEIFAFHEEYIRILAQDRAGGGGAQDDAPPAQATAAELLSRIEAGRAGSRKLFAHPSLRPLPANQPATHSQAVNRRKAPTFVPALFPTRRQAESSLRAVLAAEGPRAVHFQTPPAGSLAADCAARAAMETFAADPLPRSSAAVAAHLRSREMSFRSLARDLLRLAEAVDLLARDCLEALDSTAALDPATVRDVAAQIGWLCPEGFAAVTPSARLAEFPRYLEAVRRRLSAAAFDPATDIARSRQIHRVWDRYAELVRDRDAAPPFDESAAERYRWLVEEYRVAVFAQSLGTSEPVSAPRLDRLWDSLFPGPLNAGAT